MNQVHKTMKLNIIPVDDAKADFCRNILHYSQYYRKEKDNPTFPSEKSYGFDIGKFCSVFSAEEAMEIRLAFHGKDAQGNDTPQDAQKHKEITNQFILYMEKQSGFHEAFEKSKQTAEVFQKQANHAWAEHGDQANDYVERTLGLGNIETDTMDVFVGCGISHANTNGPNSIYYGGGFRSNADKKETVKSFVHELLHCVETSQQIGGSKASHAAVYLFERYFHHTRLKGENIHGSFEEPIQQWADEMKYDFFDFLTKKGEEPEMVIKFLNDYGIQMSVREVSENSTEAGQDINNWLDFRNKWHSIQESRKHQNLQQNEAHI